MSKKIVTINFPLYMEIPDELNLDEVFVDVEIHNLNVGTALKGGITGVATLRSRRVVTCE